MPINRELGEVLDRFLDEFLEASHLSSLEQMDRIIVITAIILINLDKPSLCICQVRCEAVILLHDVFPNMHR